MAKDTAELEAARLQYVSDMLQQLRTIACVPRSSKLYILLQMAEEQAIIDGQRLGVDGSVRH